MGQEPMGAAGMPAGSIPTGGVPASQPPGAVPTRDGSGVAAATRADGFRTDESGAGGFDTGGFDTGEFGSDGADEHSAGEFGAPAVGRRVPPAFAAADVLPALSTLSVIGLLGLPLGWLWSVLAPPMQVRVLSDGALIPLSMESYHRFDAIAVFVLLGAALGVLTGMACWLLRQRRGPLTALAVVGGSVLAAWLAMRTGLSFAASAHPLGDQISAGMTLVRAPGLDSPWAMVAQPLGAALAYGLATAWNGEDDLGRRLS
ncbi:putative DUF2567 family protein [Actinoalloteichus sp. GBA129-24]|uniref:DUF2567 family protein n=1 Tax=Actinoalloteichus fjordicus TaxID=1612552 RepID=A0AAC9LAJ1_9PSEU|nr:putative DUF2567 family protein [Actinoalloteichus fjordicus]APU19972.1 putative DUF2567 family protein [Actinoalloteichus sp. GBA129-24]